MPVLAEALKLAAVVHTLRTCQLFSGLPMADLETISALVSSGCDQK